MDKFADAVLDCISKGAVYYTNLPAREGSPSNKRRSPGGNIFDGNQKTLWLEEEKRAKILTILHGWLRSGSLNRGTVFN
jgi:hypothetical protein